MGAKRAPKAPGPQKEIFWGPDQRSLSGNLGDRGPVGPPGRPTPTQQGAQKAPLRIQRIRRAPAGRFLLVFNRDPLDPFRWIGAEGAHKIIRPSGPFERPFNWPKVNGGAKKNGRAPSGILRIPLAPRRRRGTPVFCLGWAPTGARPEGAYRSSGPRGPYPETDPADPGRFSNLRFDYWKEIRRIFFFHFIDLPRKVSEDLKRAF
uniref:Uncharacterized protein n=1 Tax=Placozoa sp. H2 TaxID=573895 RepID=A0A7I6NA92_9METZ|nr:hypothetical protein [Placozoa sp. H2 HM-2017]